MSSDYYTSNIEGQHKSYSLYDGPELVRDRGSDCESVATKHEPGTLTNCLRQSLILSEESRGRVSEREQKIETVPNKRRKFEKKWIFLLIATSSDDAVIRIGQI